MHNFSASICRLFTQCKNTSTHRGEARKQKNDKRNIIEQTEQVEVIFEGAKILRKLLIKKLNRNLINSVNSYKQVLKVRNSIPVNSLYIQNKRARCKTGHFQTGIKRFRK